MMAAYTLRQRVRYWFDNTTARDMPDQAGRHTELLLRLADPIAAHPYDDVNLRGSLASWVLERINVLERTGEQTQEGVADVLAELRALRAEVAALRQPELPERPVPTARTD